MTACRTLGATSSEHGPVESTARPSSPLLPLPVPPHEPGEQGADQPRSGYYHAPRLMAQGAFETLLVGHAKPQSEVTRRCRSPTSTSTPAPKASTNTQQQRVGARGSLSACRALCREALPRTSSAVSQRVDAPSWVHGNKPTRSLPRTASIAARTMNRSQARLMVSTSTTTSA